MRFTIRDLLWLMVVVSILGAWWVDHKLYSSWERKGIWMDMELRAASSKWTMPIHHWKQALNYFAILFEDRMPQTRNN